MVDQGRKPMSKPNKDKSAGPFSIHRNEAGYKFLKYDAGNGEFFSRRLPLLLFHLEHLIKWLNWVVANEETNCP